MSKSAQYAILRPAATVPTDPSKLGAAVDMTSTSRMGRVTIITYTKPETEWIDLDGGRPKMEVRLRRQPNGCIYWPLTLMTFGVFALLKSFGERHFIQQMNETGIVTRGGMRVKWEEFTRVERWQSKMTRSASAGALSDEYLLKSPKGRVSLPLWRTENATEAGDYLFQHLPPDVLSGKR